MGNKILYFDGPDGISGDMTLGALISLGADAAEIKRELDKIVPEPFDLVPNRFSRSGIHGINLDVIIPGLMQKKTEAGRAAPSRQAFHASHTHRHYSDIKEMILNSGITETAKTYALAIFNVIAEAEAFVHEVDLAEVAFHEVGALDSIIDIVGTAVAIDILGVREFYCSALHDGCGTVMCQHGQIPVPVPAVMEMAKEAGIPIIIEEAVKTEMITPTGFGIIKGLGAVFKSRLGILPEKTGYGFGKRDTGRLGALRLVLGEIYEEQGE